MAVLLCGSLDGYAKGYDWEGVYLNLKMETIKHTGFGFSVSNQVNADTRSANKAYLANNGSGDPIQKWDNFDITNEDNWDKIVFFYHPATGKWLNQGDAWGTKASLSSDYGMKCLVSMGSRQPAGLAGITYSNAIATRYFFFVCTTAASVDDDGYTGRMLSEKAFSDKEQKGDSKNNPYCDATNASGNMIAWSFIPFTDDQENCNEFGIRARWGSYKNANHVDYEHRYMTYDDENGVYIKWYDTEELAKADQNTHWRMVTLRQIAEALKANPSTVDDPFNVSFWLNDPQLARCNTDNTSWTWSAGTDCKGYGGLKLGVDNVFSGKPDNSPKNSRYGSKDDELTDKQEESVMQENGKYFCGELRPTTSSKYKVDIDGARFSQSWKCVKSGWYRLSCQGFVQDGNSKLYAYVNNSNSKRVDYQSEALRDITNYDEEAGTADVSKATMLASSKEFMNKLYPNYLYVYCEQGQTMEFGLRFKGASAWTCFDDFQLEYCGEEKVGLVLDEDATKLDYIADAYDYQKGFKNTILHLHHSFNAGYWNTIVLPVDLTKSQVEHMFGKGTKVAKFVDYQTGRIMFNRTESESTKGSTVIMEANVPYIIKPTYTKLTGGRDYDSYTDGTYQDYAATFKYYSKSGDNNQPTDQIEVTCPAPYATTRYTKAVKNDYISNEEFGTKDLYMKDDNADAKVQWNGLAFHGNLVSTYKVNEDGTKTYSDLAKGGEKYLIYQNKIAHVAANRTYGFKGLRAYFEFEKKSDSDKAQAKGVKFSIDGVDEDTDNVTGIDGLFEGGIANTDGYDGKVYDLNGRVVNTCGSTAGLTKGIYIVKGKKVVVK